MTGFEEFKMAIDFYTDDLGRLICKFIDNEENKEKSTAAQVYYRKNRERILEQKKMSRNQRVLKKHLFDTHIPIKTFCYMAGVSVRDVINYCNNQNVKNIIKRADGWYLPESLQKIFKPKISVRDI